MFGEPGDGFASLLSELDLIKPDVVLVAYGGGEAGGYGIQHAGEDAGDPVASFERSMDRLLDTLATRSIRVGIAPPVGVPGMRSTGYRRAMNRIVDCCRTIAKERSLVLVDIGGPLPEPLLTIDGLFPNADGYAQMASIAASSLFAGEPYGSVLSEPLVSAIIEKDRLVFHRLRPQKRDLPVSVPETRAGPERGRDRTF